MYTPSEYESNRQIFAQTLMIQSCNISQSQSRMRWDERRVVCRFGDKSEINMTASVLSEWYVDGTTLVSCLVGLQATLIA